MSRRKRFRDFVNRNYEATWFIGLLVVGSLFVLLSWMFTARPCMTDPDNWPYSADWWPGKTGLDSTPAEIRARCGD
jgi:hypothetical protein